MSGVLPLVCALLTAPSSVAEEATPLYPAATPAIAERVASGALTLTAFSRQAVTGLDTLRFLVATATFEPADKNEPTLKVRVDDCATLYALLRNVTPPQTIGTDAFPLVRTAGRLALGDQVLIDDAAHWCFDALIPFTASTPTPVPPPADKPAAGKPAAETPAADKPAPKPAPDPRCTPGRKACANDFVNLRVELLSIVGPFVSWATVSSSTLGGSSSHGIDWTTWNLATKAPATLAEVLDETSLREALGKDAWVQKTLGKDFLPTLATSDLVFAALGDHTEGAKDFTRFAFMDYNPKKGLARVEIAYHQGVCAQCPNDVTRLGLWVKPKPEWKAAFDDLAKGQGFLGSNEKAPRSLYAGFVAPKK